MKTTIILLNICAAFILLMAPVLIENAHDAHSLSVYRGLVHNGLIRENPAADQAEKAQERQREDAIVAELQKIGAVRFHYRLLAWPAGLLLVLNSWVLLRKRSS